MSNIQGQIIYFGNLQASMVGLIVRVRICYYYDDSCRTMGERGRARDASHELLCETVRPDDIEIQCELDQTSDLTRSNSNKACLD